MDQNNMKKEILEFNLENEKNSSNDRFHILSADEIDSIFGEDNPLDSTTTLDEIAAMDFDDYEVVKEHNNIQVPVEKKKKIFADKHKDNSLTAYRMRLIVSFTLIVVLFFISVYIFIGSISTSPAKDISYAEESNIQYKVYLKENDIYQKDYLNEKMTYISSLIQLIRVNMNYQFQFSEEANVQYQYHIDANMMIVDKNDPSKVYYNEKNVLVEEVVGKIENEKLLSIDPEVTIDYNYYNDISNRFRSSYGYETNNYLVISLSIHEIGSEPFSLNQTSTPSIQIPLSEDEIQIKTDNVKKKKIILADKHYPIRNLFHFFLGFILGTLSIIVFVKFITQFIKSEKERRLHIVKRYETKKNYLDE